MHVCAFAFCVCPVCVNGRGHVRCVRVLRVCVVCSVSTFIVYCVRAFMFSKFLSYSASACTYAIQEKLQSLNQSFTFMQAEACVCMCMYVSVCAKSFELALSN